MAPSVSRRVPAVFALSLLLTSLLSGCVTESDEGPEDEVVVEEKVLKGAWLALVEEAVNDTLYLWMREYVDDYSKEICEDAWDSQYAFRVYDRNGLFLSYHVNLGTDWVEENISIPLSGGEPPFLFGSSLVGCITRADLGGIIRGHKIHLWEYPEIDEFAVIDHRVHLSVTVPAGETEASIGWTPTVYTTRVTWADTLEREGSRWGHFLFEAPNGEMIRSYDHRIGGQQKIGPAILMDGEYRLSLELQNPHPSDTTWTMEVSTERVTSDLCMFGFEWEICSGG